MIPTTRPFPATVAAALLLAVAAPLSPVAAQQSLGASHRLGIRPETPGYVVVDLGTLGGSMAEALDIDESGVICGWATLPSSAKRPVLWAAGDIVNLGQPPGFGVGEAVAVNAVGQVAVEAGLGVDAQYGAFLWEQEIWTPLPPLGARPEAIPEDLDDAGRVVGRSFTLGGGDQRAVLWDQGRVVDLGTLTGSGTSQADAINAAGRIVGRVFTPDVGNRAFLWADGVMVDLGVQAGKDEAAAFGIDDAGRVVGESWSTSIPSFQQTDRATLWVGPGGPVVDVGLTPVGSSTTTGICVPTGVWTASTARAVNDAGQVVGAGRCISSGADQAAFLWQDGVHHNLNDLVVGGAIELELVRANAINEAGQIVGLAYDPANNLRAFLLEPVSGSTLLQPGPPPGP